MPDARAITCLTASGLRYNVRKGNLALDAVLGQAWIFSRAELERFNAKRREAVERGDGRYRIPDEPVEAV